MKSENLNSSHNPARFFTQNRQIASVALLATLAWGVFGYMNMPKRKDPDIPVRIALAITPWPGISADKVEQLVTRKVEQAATGNSKVDRVESTTQDNISVVQVRLLDSIKNTQHSGAGSSSARPGSMIFSAGGGHIASALDWRP